MRLATFIGMLTFSMSAAAFDLDKLKARLDELKQPAAATSAPAANSSGLAQFSAQQQADSLKQALTQGAETAVKNLAKENGYLGNDKVRIPLPENLHKAERTMRKFGMGKYADELITSMNRAAEAAVPEAKTLLIGAVKNMTVTDAKDHPARQRRCGHAIFPPQHRNCTRRADSSPSSRNPCKRSAWRRPMTASPAKA